MDMSMHSYLPKLRQAMRHRSPDPVSAGTRDLDGPEPFIPLPSLCWTWQVETGLAAAVIGLGYGYPLLDSENTTIVVHPSVENIWKGWTDDNQGWRSDFDRTSNILAKYMLCERKELEGYRAREPFPFHLVSLVCASHISICFVHAFYSYNTFDSTARFVKYSDEIDWNHVDSQ
ncbi:hypothetical protein BGZ63DRAFT_396063 [Mariannaea sp. PMI_226]|nr:hypothetical protein BGZ63DRAFT_396063 [Mariannaea sp. PMI_226]